MAYNAHTFPEARSSIPEDTGIMASRSTELQASSHGLIAAQDRGEPGWEFRLDLSRRFASLRRTLFRKVRRPCPTVKVRLEPILPLVERPYPLLSPK
jgi:hypothetical protein